MKKEVNEKITDLRNEIVSEEIKERDRKLFESQKELMDIVQKESIEHGKEDTADLLKKEKAIMLFKNETEGQKLTYNMSTTIVEPLRNNRFIVSFPKELDVVEWSIKSITMPIISRRKCGDTVIVFRKFIKPLTSKTIVNLVSKKNFDINVKFLDATGAPIENWCISVKKAISVDFGGFLDYSDDGVSEIKVVFKTKDCILKD